MKKNIDDIIEYENEHSCLDFKRSQYLKPQYGELLKDIIAMANVISEEVKLIVIGIKHLPNGVREFHSIIDKDFIDAATYQQLIRENIEPDLQVNYESYRYKDNLFGIFHLLDCSNPPYLLKKDFGDKLKKGDCFIRKGSHQTRINRSDLDKFYESKNKKPNFSEVIEIGFLNTSCFKEITIQTTNLNDLPSEVEARKIRHALENRKLETQVFSENIHNALFQLEKFNIPPLFQNTPYEKRDAATLEKNLEKIEEAYEQANMYEIAEIRSFKLNFEVLNNGNEYLQDASVIIQIPNQVSYTVASQIVDKPSTDLLNINFNQHSIKSPFRPNYPKVEYREENIFISEYVGDIKHHQKTKVFGLDVRLIVPNVPDGGVIPIDFKLFGKNLPQPIFENLMIKVE